MRSAFWQPPMDRRRAITFLIVIALHILLVAIFILLSPPRPHGPEVPRDIQAFNVLPSLKESPKPAPKPKQTAAKAAKPAAAKAVAVPAPPTKLFTVQMFEGVDISKLPNHSAEVAAAGSGDTSGDSQLAEGTGPGGQKLYKAEWQREPTNAELSFYLRNGAPEGSWALIACRTVERYRVEDCKEMGESPRGSHLAREMVEASFQFRVRPPRVGGQAQVGEWVSIYFSFSKNAEE